MKFLCGSCRTKYQIGDDKVRGKILTIRCKKCGAKVVVKESLVAKDEGIPIAPVADELGTEQAEVVASASQAKKAAQGGMLSSAFQVAMQTTDDLPTAISPTPANEAHAGIEWFVAIDGKQHGPYAYAELVRRIQEKEVQGRHYTWHEGFDGWKRVRDVEDLAKHVPGEKKKTAPPPPPIPGEEEPGAESANVVDFARKRAEREQGRRSQPPSRTEDLSPTEPVTAKSDRQAELDQVLNRTLGLSGEDIVKAAPGSEAEALQRQAGARLPSGEEGIPEDLFASVPRASTQEVVAKEATRFFVAAAGVNLQKTKNKVFLLLGGLGVLAFVSFMGAWAIGYITIEIPGIGDPFARLHRAPEVTDDEGRELSEEERKRLAALLEGRSPEERAKVRRAARRGADPKLGDYVNDAEGPGGTQGPRGEGGAVGIGIELSAQGGPGAGGVGQAVLPSANLDNVPLPDSGGRLSPEAIRAVINDGRKAVLGCYQRELKGNDGLRGKVEFLVTVSPEGVVSKVGISTPLFKGTALGNCISDKIKEWRFPKFVGEPEQVIVPFVLERGSY